MPSTMTQLEHELFYLDLDARAQLAGKIILSIDAPGKEENLRLWASEAERRMTDLCAGKVREYPAEEVLPGVKVALS